MKIIGKEFTNTELETLSICVAVILFCATLYAGLFITYVKGKFWK